MFTNNVHRVSQSAFFITHCHILFELILFGWIASIINLCVLILVLVTGKSSPFGISEHFHFGRKGLPSIKSGLA